MWPAHTTAQPPTGQIKTDLVVQLICAEPLVKRAGQVMLIGERDGLLVLR